MPITGRSFPTHTKIAKAGISNVSVTLSVVSATTPAVNKTIGKTLSITSATNPVLTALIVKLQTLSVASATTSTIATKKGAGRILSVTSLTVPTMSRGITKSLTIQSPSVPILTKTIGKVLGTPVLSLSFSLKSKIILNNFDGGVRGPAGTNTLQEPTVVTVAPGLFRIAPPKGIIKIQFRPFNIPITKRVPIP